MNRGATRFNLRAVLSRARAGSRAMRLRGRSMRAAAGGARGRATDSLPLIQASEASPGPSPDAGPASPAELTALRTELAHELERLAAEPSPRGRPVPGPSGGPSA